MLDCNLRRYDIGREANTTHSQECEVIQEAKPTLQACWMRRGILVVSLKRPLMGERTIALHAYVDLGLADVVCRVVLGS